MTPASLLKHGFNLFNKHRREWDIKPFKTPLKVPHGTIALTRKSRE